MQLEPGQCWGFVWLGDAGLPAVIYVIKSITYIRYKLVILHNFTSTKYTEMQKINSEIR